MNNEFEERLLPRDEVERVTTLKKDTIYRLEREGKFPRRRKIVGDRVGWLASEVNEWILNREVKLPDQAA